MKLRVFTQALWGYGLANACKDMMLQRGSESDLGVACLLGIVEDHAQLRQAFKDPLHRRMPIVVHDPDLHQLLVNNHRQLCIL